MATRTDTAWMSDLADVLTPEHPVAHRREFLAKGISKRQVYRWLASGAIARARIGWFYLPGTDPEIVEATRIGGRLDCVNAARLHGLDCPPEPGLHVRLPETAARLRSPKDGYVNTEVEQIDAILHWDSDSSGRDGGGVVPLIACLLQVILCQPADWAVAIIDSAIRRGHPLLSTVDLDRLRQSTPRRHRWIFDFLDTASESCIESLTRFRLAVLGMVCQSQVSLLPGIRVDLLLFGWLVIEVDGREFHTGVDTFERDRDRDAALNAAGYRPLHFSYRQVVYCWDTIVLPTILRVIPQGPPIRPALLP